MCACTVYVMTHYTFVKLSVISDKLCDNVVWYSVTWKVLELPINYWRKSLQPFAIFLFVKVFLQPTGQEHIANINPQFSILRTIFLGHLSSRDSTLPRRLSHDKRTCHLRRCLPSFAQVASRELTSLTSQQFNQHKNGCYQRTVELFCGSGGYGMTQQPLTCGSYPNPFLLL